MVAESRQFIAEQTRPAAPPLVPELHLYLASEVTPLWEATEAFLERTGLPPPYWAFAWPGGQAVARHIFNHPELVAGRRVLDFAAGSGIGALAAMKAGAAFAMATDLDPVACEAIAMNATLNGLDLDVSTADVVDQACEAFDVVMAGDVCYEQPMAGRVIGWLRRLAATRVLVLMGDPGRAYVPRSGLQHLASYTVPTSRDLEDRDRRETSVWRVLPD